MSPRAGSCPPDADEVIAAAEISEPFGPKA
jgi:hypothetical protein